MTARRLDPTILREYDIRGVVGKTIGVADAHAIGRAFGTFIRKGSGSKISVGRDGRLSSPALAKALIDGLVMSGITVADIGLGPSPMLYVSVQKLKMDAGIMVTGSHNPSDHNGFKMLHRSGPIYGRDITKLGEIAASGKFKSDPGEAHQRPFLDAYVNLLQSTIDTKKLLVFNHGKRRPPRVVWDAGSGATGEALVKLTALLPGKHFLLNEEIDGRFPAHHPDPTVPKNLEQIQDAVREHKADLGIAFDGDGDRIGIVDGQARILWPDQLLAILARPVRAYGSIIADVKASQALFDEINDEGGHAIMWKTGHSLIKSKMKEENSPLSGEMSGHIFFKDWWGYDDALYVALRLLRRLSAHPKKSLAQIFDELPQPLNTPEMRFPCPENRKFAVVKEVKARLRRARAKFSHIDGVRVLTPDGWWLLRASNTQDVLVARAEAKNADGLARLKAQLARELAASGLTLPSDAAGH